MTRLDVVNLIDEVFSVCAAAGQFVDFSLCVKGIQCCGASRRFLLNVYFYFFSGKGLV